MLQVVSELNIPKGKETFGIPSQIVVYDSMALSDFGVVGGMLRFLVIAKTLWRTVAPNPRCPWCTTATVFRS
ncbi:Inositol-tetrakisphosphate 1-kinase 1 [Platanthera zijinensis]|uniref:Inositol-tetrakisphosphate 1-kinase 1 n=1 Tax=Platanthera zijinensis TaxID=2320716 RepID=A0AAP0B9S4_9ASPA